MFKSKLRSTLAVCAVLTPVAAAMAQQDDERWGPFSAFEAGQLSVVWNDIRREDEYDDIDWGDFGLRDAPGDRDAREIMEDNWDALRRAARFEDIDWQRSTGFRSSSRFDFSNRDRITGSTGPFTSWEAEQLSEAWPEIRQAAAFEQIDWRAVGLRDAPGDEEAQEIMARNWGSIRTAARFEDIDWSASTDYRASNDDAEFGRNRDDRDFARNRDDRDNDAWHGPFREYEAERIAEVWSDIRVARDYEDIDWRAVGLAYPPGDAEAREIMSRNWDALRRAERFEDIDWEQTTRYDVATRDR